MFLGFSILPLSAEEKGSNLAKETQGVRKIKDAKEVQFAPPTEKPPAEKEEKKLNDDAYRWWSHFFISSSLQTFIAVSKLKDYTLPKPGWRASLGYTFLHEKKHSIPLSFEIGHSVVSGTNPLVRTFDVYPILLNVAYEYSPIQMFSFGATLGLGLFVSHIQHFPTVVDMVTNNLQKTKAAGGAFSLAAQVGVNFAEKNVEIRSNISLDLILEKPQLIPLPSFQIGMRLYPEALYRYAKKKGKTIVEVKEVTKEVPVVKETTIVKEVPVVKEVIKEVPVRIEEEEPVQLETMFVYFLGNSAVLDLNAIAQVKKAAEVLKEHEDLFILFEGSTAQFGSVMGRQKLEAKRVGNVVKYLEESGIAKHRIMYTPQMREDEPIEENKDYTQHRYVRMRFIRIKFNMNSGEKNVYKN